MRLLLPLLLAACTPVEIILDDIQGGTGGWDSGPTNPDLSDLCTVGEADLDSFGFLGDLPSQEAYHFCGTVDGKDDILSVRYGPNPFTFNIRAKTYGYTTAQVMIVEWPADLPNAIEDNNFTVLDQFILDGEQQMSYYVEPTEDNAYMSIIIDGITTSNFNEYFVRIEHEKREH